MLFRDEKDAAEAALKQMKWMCLQIPLDDNQRTEDRPEKPSGRICDFDRMQQEGQCLHKQNIRTDWVAARLRAVTQFQTAQVQERSLCQRKPEPAGCLYTSRILSEPGRSLLSAN